MEPHIRTDTKVHADVIVIDLLSRRPTILTLDSNLRGERMDSLLSCRRSADPSRTQLSGVSAFGPHESFEMTTRSSQVVLALFRIPIFEIP